MLLVPTSLLHLSFQGLERPVQKPPLGICWLFMARRHPSLRGHKGVIKAKVHFETNQVALSGITYNNAV